MVILCTCSFHVIVKAKTPERVVNSRSKAGISDRTQAEECKVTYLPVHVIRIVQKRSELFTTKVDVSH